MKSRRDYLNAIAESEGYSDWVSFFADRQHALMDAVAPAICVDCDFITEMEGDQEEGYCENCDSNRVKSCLILAGLI